MKKEEEEFCNFHYMFFQLVSWPEGSKGTFWFLNQAAISLPHTAKASHCPF